MSWTNLVLGGNWDGEMPEYVEVGHEGEGDYTKYVPERTCRMTFLWSDFEDGECYECSACGEVAFTHGGAPSYCPHCGGRIDDGKEEGR